jgi:hypothetical protein
MHCVAFLRVGVHKYALEVIEIVLGIYEQVRKNKHSITILSHLLCYCHRIFNLLMLTFDGVL